MVSTNVSDTCHSNWATPHCEDGKTSSAILRLDSHDLTNSRNAILGPIIHHLTESDNQGAFHLPMIHLDVTSCFVSDVTDPDTMGLYLVMQNISVCHAQLRYQCAKQHVTLHTAL